MILLFYFVLIVFFNRCNFGDAKNTTLYWNVRTSACNVYDYNFEQLLEQTGIKVNKFQDNKIVHIRNPGLFPRVEKNSNGEKYCINNCIPERGNLSLHLDKLRDDIETIIPDPEYNGLAVIRFDGWDPLFEFNDWRYTEWYREIAFVHQMAYQRQLWYGNLEGYTEEKFNSHAKPFFENSLKLAKEVRPHAKWGFYNYPKCSSWTDDYKETCLQIVLKANDKLMWLFNASDALFPAFEYQLNYTRSNYYDYPKYLFQEPLKETKRLVEKTGRNLEVYAYLSLKFVNTEEYLDESDIRLGLQTIRETDIADGVIMWLNEEELDDQNKCTHIYKLMSDFVAKMNTTVPIPNLN